MRERIAVLKSNLDSQVSFGAIETREGEDRHTGYPKLIDKRKEGMIDRTIS